MTKRPRICVFAPHFAEYASRLAVALAADAEVLLVAEARNLAAECAGLDLGAGAARLAHVTYASDLALRQPSLRGAWERRRVRRAIAAFRPDIVHVQEQGDRFTAALVEAVAASRPVVVTVHDPVPHSGNDALVAQRFAGGLARIRAAASAFHVHGAYCERLLRRNLATDKPIAATAHGVILVPSPGEGREPGEAFLFFGRMEAYKGLETLVDTIGLLPEGHGLRFVLAGRGPELERLRTRVSQAAAIEVFDQFLPPAEAIRQFQRARAVIVPYRDATQSGVVAAAMGNGRPVIASRVGGLADAVEEGVSGLLVPPDDPPALARAISAMAEDATCRRLTEGARAAATDRFAWSAVAGRLNALYTEISAPV